VLGEHPADFDEFVDRLKVRTGLKGKALFQPLRAALTGRLDGPELALLVPLMGAARVRHRFERYS
jgi:glutamyl-tRNA synthetase